jgi:hypothetical protein
MNINMSKKKEIIKSLKKHIKDGEIVRKYLRKEMTKEEFDKTGIKLVDVLGFKTLTKEEVEANRPKDAYDYVL